MRRHDMKLTRRTQLSMTLVSLALLGLAHTAATQPAQDMVEPRAGVWKIWVRASGSELRLPPPPDRAATQAELTELKRLAAQRNTAALESMWYWNAGAPSYRWNEILTDTAVAQNHATVGRAFAMLNVA